MASYAKFLWDAEEEEDGKDEEEELDRKDVFSTTTNISTATSTNMWQGFQAQPPPIATAS